MQSQTIEKDLPEDLNALIQRFASAENVCVLGLGKLWRDHFCQEYWHEGLGVNVFSDNNPELHGTFLNGIECVKPSELSNYPNLLVVVFVKNGNGIIAQLNQMGIHNCITIREIDDQLGKNIKRSMTK